MSKSSNNSDNKSLNKSFGFISKLLIKDFQIPIIQFVLISDKQLYIYPNEQAKHYNFNSQKGIFQKSLNENDVVIFNTHPFEGISKDIKFYASAPLISSIGNTLGLLIILDTKERSFSTEEISLLKDFAQIATDTVEKHFEIHKMQAVFTDFLHKTVHDLKNPLTSISLTSELLKRKSHDTKTVISFSERLEKSSSKLLYNLENLKKVFPLKNDSFKLDIIKIKPDELLTDVKNCFKTSNITIESMHESELQTDIYADYNRLKEAVLQLINHVSLSSDASVLLKSYLRDKEAIIEISCTGYSHNDSTSLTISKTLVEMHKGKIEIIEDNYYICLPLLETP